MATKTITSDQNESKVGPNGTPIFTSTRITYTFDENGKVDPNATKFEILYKSAHFGSPTVGAVRTGADKDWSFPLKAGFGDPVLGADAQKSLKEGALKTTTNQQIDAATKKEGFTPEQRKAVSLTSNQATSTEGTNTISAVDLNIQGTGKQGSFGNYTYPQGLGSTKQDVIKFSMLKYVPQSIATKGTFEGGALGGFTSDGRGKEILGTVILPIPSGISESNGVNWGGDTMTPFQALEANVALTAISAGVKATGEKLGGMAEGLDKSGGDVKTAVAFKFSEAAANVGNLLSRTQGAVFNPNLELLFNGPTLRPFSFTFKMSARSETEAKQIIRIIRFFKQGMSPQKTESTLYLKAPHTFRIQYLYRPGGDNNNHPYIGQIKECALQNFIVNYTPEGQYATFQDGIMVSYEIQMQFQELEPVFNEDYGGGEFPSDLLFRETKVEPQKG